MNVLETFFIYIEGRFQTEFSTKAFRVNILFIPVNFCSMHIKFFC